MLGPLSRRMLPLVTGSLALALVAGLPTPAPAGTLRCPTNMARVGGFCIDRWEASTVELDARGRTRPHPPNQVVGGRRVRAITRRNVLPQAYISRNEAAAACREAGKRLCTDDEWVTACRGPKRTRFPYGDDRRPNACADTSRVAPLAVVFAAVPEAERYASWDILNDPRLDAVPGGLARTGTFGKCTNAWRVYDMVGNLHEWTASPAGTFRGGYFLDTSINGEGCEYKTLAHDASYHDYSTGFRCCASPKAK